MNRKQKTVLLKRAGTKKHYKEAMQKHRCRSFLNQKLGTVTHKTAKDYDRLLAVILLHDVCEDCGIAPEDLPFSSEVQEAVSLLTKNYDRNLSKQENETRYYDALKKNRLAAMAKVIDRCNNVSTMAGSFNDKKIAEYIDETETYVFPVLSVIKQTWPECNNAVFLIKYQMLSVLESLKIMLSEK